LYVLQTGIPWEELPQELGFGSGMTCWRRLRERQAAGVWAKLHLALLQRLREHDQIDWGRASIDGARRYLDWMDGQGSGPASCMPIKATITRAADITCESEASRRALPAKASKAATAWAGIGR
jgi:transposase